MHKFNNNIVISPINFHCDFEKGKSNAKKNFSIYKYQIFCLAL